MKKINSLILLIICTINSSWAATISAQVDRNPVQLDETFNLFFEADAAVDDDPDFSPLDTDFEVINQSHSSNVSIINGQYSKKIKWSLVLMAKRAGTLTIPSIHFGKDTSPSIRLSVQSGKHSIATANPDVFMELETRPEKAWVQGQIIVTLRFLSAINLSAFSGFPELKTEGVDAVAEKLGEHKQYQSKRGNRQYLVLEQHYAVFPQQSGTLTIPPQLTEARLASRSSSMFDPFQRSGQIKRVRTPIKDIKIESIPGSFTGSHWLPAAEIQVSEEWPEDTGTYEAGEPITRTLTIMADGLSSAQLPEFKTQAIENIKQYPDKPALQDIKKDTGVIGIRQEKIAYIPTHAGRYSLPAIHINWWNSKTEQMETATLPATTLQIVPGDIKAAAPGPTPVETPQVSADAPAEAIITTTDTTHSDIWFSVSLFLASGWLLTLATWWLLAKRKHRHHPNSPGTQVSLKQALQQLKKACQQNDAHACNEALITWGQLLYPEHRISSSGQLAKLAGEPLQTEINRLLACLYGHQPQHWNSGELALICDQLSQTWRSQADHARHQLEPLHK